MLEAKVYRALGDPLRLQIVQRLAAGAPSTIGELSANLGVTRQGARKQLQVLVEAEVVHLAPQGRETRVTLDTRTLRRAQQFIATLEQQWDQRLAALKTFVEDDNEGPEQDSQR